MKNKNVFFVISKPFSHHNHDDIRLWLLLIGSIIDVIHLNSIDYDFCKKVSFITFNKNEKHIMEAYSVVL